MAGIFEGVMFIAESTTFIQFILEEAIQTGGMAAYMLLRAGKKSQAREAIIATRNEALYWLRRVNDEYGHFAPYSRDAFRIFADMSDMNLTYLEQLTFE